MPSDAALPHEDGASVRHLFELGYEDPRVVAAQKRREADLLEASLKQAQQSLEAGELTGAIESLTRLADQSPESPRPHRLLARAYVGVGDSDAALGELRWLEVHGYEHAEFALLRATIALGRRELDEAIDQAEYARSLRSPLAAADVLLGEAHFRRGDLQSSRAAFQAAIDCDSRHVTALVGLAAVCLREGDFESSIDWGLQALDVEMRQPAVHYRLGLALMSMGLRREAAAALEMAANLNSEFAAPHRLLANLYAGDDPPRAAEHRRRGRKIIAQRRSERARRRAPDATSGDT